MQENQNQKSSSHEYGIENVGLTVVVSRVLQIGVILSSIIIGFGMLLSFLHSGSQQINVQLPFTPTQIISGVLALQPEAVIFLGLIILIATPVIRVAISIVSFAFEHDRTFVVISSIVLAILLTSFMLAKGGA
jgi:uncharacterized membrane protein